VGNTGVTKIMILAYLVELHYPVIEIEIKVVATVIFTLITSKLSCVLCIIKGQFTWQIEIPKAAPGIRL
jgi:hypothetical protein